jgi:hypothetical protein
MDPSDPDIEELFAPVRPTDTFGVVLSEARDVLSHVHAPVDAELWGSDMIGALGGAAIDVPAVMTTLTHDLIPAAEKDATPESLALLRIFGAVGDARLRVAARAAADRVAAGGVAEPEWAAAIGSPEIGESWHFADIGGRQESVTITFSYPGAAAHAFSVLIDHSRGGQVKDIWVGDAAGLIDKTRQAAEADPNVVFEPLAAEDALTRLRIAVRAGECPQDPDQRDSVAAHRALLAARLETALASKRRRYDVAV